MAADDVDVLYSSIGGDGDIQLHDALDVCLFGFCRIGWSVLEDQLGRLDIAAHAQFGTWLSPRRDLDCNLAGGLLVGIAYRNQKGDGQMRIEVGHRGSDPVDVTAPLQFVAGMN